MIPITFECTSITPMLMHGADGSSAELRPASIKGMLRFWWRAIHGNLSLDNLREKEGEIFGSTEGRSKVTLRIANITETKKSFHALTKDINSNSGINYNFYPIVMKNEGKTYFDSLIFDLILSSNDNEDLEEAINALMYLNFFGGLGSRTRRGAGSIKITLKENKENLFQEKLSLLNTSKITTKEAFKEHIDTLFKDIPPHSSPAYTTFYKHIYIFEPKKDWKSALERIAQPFQEFRNTHQSDVLETPNFGFPIQHKNGGGTFMGGNIKKYKDKDKDEDKEKAINLVERRTSPLIFKIFKTSKGRYFPLLLWMEGNLLPNENQVILKKQHQKGDETKLPDDQIVKDFIATLKNYEEITKNGN